MSYKLYYGGVCLYNLKIGLSIKKQSLVVKFDYPSGNKTYICKEYHQTNLVIKMFQSDWKIKIFSCLNLPQI